MTDAFAWQKENFLDAFMHMAWSFLQCDYSTRIEQMGTHVRILHFYKYVTLYVYTYNVTSEQSFVLTNTADSNS